MRSKAEQLDEIVRLARAHDIAIDEIRQALADGPSDAPGDSEGKGSILTRALAYLGGTFVFAGLGVFIAMHWDSMNFAARVVITLGVGIAAFLMALIALRDERYDKAAAPLFLIAALLQPAGLLVIFEEFSTGRNPDIAGLITSGIMATQQLLTFVATRRTTLLFTGISFVAAFVLILFDMVDIDYEFTALVLGGSLLSLTVVVDQTRHKAITPFWYFVAAMWFLFGCFSLLEGSVVEVLFLAIAVVIVYLSTIVRSRVLLFVGTVALLAYVGYFSNRHFVDSIGWPLALVLFGLLLIGLSAAALRINRRYIST